MTERHRTTMIRRATAAFTTTVVLAVVAPAAVAGTPESRATQASPDVAATTVLTWPELVKLLRIPKPGGWASGDLTSWELTGEVSASRVFSNSQTTGPFTMIATAVDTWEDAAASTQMWNTIQDEAAKKEGVTVISRTPSRSVLYGVGQYNERGVSVYLLFGPWSVSATCYTNRPKVSVGTLTACATKTAKAQQKKAAPVIAPG